MKTKFIVILLIGFFTFSECMSCTIFYFIENGNKYFCNNEDWSDPDTEIRFYPAKRGKYAWVYFGFSDDWAQGGVNEKGLCWDWVAGYKVDDWKFDKSKKTFRGNLSEEMVRRCASVEEATEFLLQYNEESFAYARMMIADRHGNSAILGWRDGNLDIQLNKGNIQAFGYKGNAVRKYFASNQSEKNIEFIAETLNIAHQEGKYPTQYSNIISITEGKIYLYKSHNYNEYVEINYLRKLDNEYASYKMADLFRNSSEYSGVTRIGSN